MINNRLGLTLPFGGFSALLKCGADRRNKRDNATQQAIADKTNDTNYKIWQEQKDYDYQMWKENNAYNDPSAQRQRMEEAGINPNVIASQVTSGTSESPASSGDAPTAIASDYSPSADVGLQEASTLNSIAGGFSDIGRQFQQNQLDSATARKASTDADIGDIELSYRAAQLQGYINNLHKQGLLTDEQARNLRVQSDIIEKTQPYTIAQKKAESENAVKQGRVLDADADLKLSTSMYTETQNLLARTDLKYADRKARMEISKMSSEIAVNGAQALLLGQETELVKKQILTEVENRLKVAAETYHIKADSKTIDDLRDALTSKAFEEAEKTRQEVIRERGNNQIDFENPTGRVVHTATHSVFGR